jgi:hypothetical protein
MALTHRSRHHCVRTTCKPAGAPVGLVSSGRRLPDSWALGIKWRKSRNDSVGHMTHWLSPLFATRQPPRSTAQGSEPKSTTMCAPRHALEVAPVLAPGRASAVVPQQEPRQPSHAPLRHALANEPRKACRARSAAQAYAARQPSSRMEVRRIYPSSKPSAQDHAQRLLEWLQDDPSLVGHLVPVREIEWAYFFLCDELEWKHVPWQSVAAQLKRLTGGERPYRRVDGRNVRVYPIPAPRGEARNRVRVTTLTLP